MLSMLKMDFRRLFRCKSFYLAILIYVGFTAYCMYTQTKWQVINQYQIPQHLQLDAGLYSIVDYYLTMPIQFMYIFALKNGFLIFGIFMVSFISSEYQSGFIKNSVMMCKNKNIIILNKFILSVFVSMLIVCLSFLLSVILGYFYVDEFMLGNISDIFIYFGSAVLLNTAFFSAITFLYRLLNNKIPSILICVLLPLGLTALFLQPIIKNFIDYTISGVFLSLPIYFETDVSLRCILVCLVYIGLYQGLSMLLIQKRDI